MEEKVRSVRRKGLSEAGSEGERGGVRERGSEEGREKGKGGKNKFTAIHHT